MIIVGNIIMLLDSSLPKKTNEELKQLIDRGDTETIILCHLKLAASLAKRYGSDDEYFGAAIFGLVLGVDRLKNLKHDNVTGYLVWWMHRYIREVKRPSISIEIDPEQYGFSDIDDTIESLPYLEQAIIIMKSRGFTNEDICSHLETTQWFISKAKSQLKMTLKY